jgi:hypothetical protein
VKKLRPNIFLVAFVLGAVVLTVLPFLQRKFLNAPPPIASLAPWTLSTSTGKVVTSADLKGHVYLAGFVEAACDAGCRTRHDAFGRGAEHIADLDGGVMLVSLIAGPDVPPSTPLWLQLGGAEALDTLDGFRQVWWQWAQTDAGTTPQEFASLPGFAVVDQDGALRGFWRDDVAGRGNAINAARLLAEHGTSPGR